jgi:hypothetical protein
MQKSTLFLLIISFLFFQNCASTKQKGWLKNHHSELEMAANSTQTAEEKMDILIGNYVKLMGEGLRFANPAKGVRYIQKYQKQNDSEIKKIVGSSQNWVENLNAVQKIGLATRIAGKPWLKDFVSMTPKFKKKYKQYQFITEMTGTVARGFGNIGGKVFSL